jgi:cytidine deaminase
MAENRNHGSVPSPANSSDEDELLEAARNAARHAYAPYSGFAVGAAVRAADGEIFTGANVENASYGVTLCAEVGAIQSAANAGVFDRITQLAVVGGHMDPSKGGSQDVTTPCGRCRQLLVESAFLGGTDITVWCADLSLQHRVTSTIHALLPSAFGPNNLREMTSWRELQRAFQERIAGKS